MGKVKWGVIVAVVAVLAVMFLGRSGLFDAGDQSGGDKMVNEPSGSTDAASGETPTTEDTDAATGSSAGTSRSVETAAGSDGAPQTEQTGAESEGSGQPEQTAAGSEGSGQPEQTAAGSEGSGQPEQTAAGSEGSGQPERTAAGSEGSGQPEQTAAGSDAPKQDDSAASAGGAEPSSRAGSGQAGSNEGSESEKALQQEAEAFVQELAEPSGEPVRVDRAETFVGADRPLAAGDSESDPESVPRQEVVAVEAEAPREPESAESAEAAEVDASPSATTSVTDESTSTPEARKEVEEAATETETALSARVDLPLSEEAPITIAELLGPEAEIPSDAVFYVHTVQTDDDQGIWGIVHEGIVENFATGVAVNRGQTTDTYRVDIPRNADERRPDDSSSFLGKLIHEKTRESYVYNYRAEKIGRNPDLIIPGQEIVIVSFTPEELISIYKYFARQEG